MVNRPRAIGTYAETAVVRAARANGFPWADRFALHGSADVGDVALCPGVIIEVKGGEMAYRASDRTIERWLDETADERLHARAAVAFLVVQRPSVGAPNAHRWWAYWRLAWLGVLDDRGLDLGAPGLMPVRCTLGESLTLLRAAGFGDPL